MAARNTIAQPKLERSVIYTRVSTDEQAKNGYGLSYQAEKSGYLAKAQSRHIAQTYQDDGYSGFTTARPALQRLLQDIREGKVSRVYVYKLDRISRRLKDLLTIYEDAFESNGVALVSVSESFDTSTPQGRLFFQLCGSFAEYERSTIAERCMSGRHKAAQEGKWTGGVAPFGYAPADDPDEPGALVIVPNEADTVRRIFAMKDDGAVLLKIAATLNDGAVPTRKPGGKWTATTIRRILQRKDFYAGRAVINSGIELEAAPQHEPILREQQS